MYKGKKVSLILPAYNEKEAIKGVIRSFSKIRYIDEIVVVDNNSKDATARLARETKTAKVVCETKQGYGYALQRGMRQAKGDILVTCDADATYISSDIVKLLRQANKYDFVWSTRMFKEYLLPNANMGFYRRIANIFFSKLIQISFSPKTNLTDLGATFRLLNRKPYEVIKNKFTIGGGQFQPELTILALKNGFSIKEVPVHYGPRVGTSKISGSLMGGIKTAWRMLKVIISYEFKN